MATQPSASDVHDKYAAATGCAIMLLAYGILLIFIAFDPSIPQGNDLLGERLAIGGIGVILALAAINRAVKALKYGKQLSELDAAPYWDKKKTGE